MRMTYSLPIAYALAAAALFGASTPLAKLLLGELPPLLLAGLLYLGSGVGLGAWIGLRRSRGGLAGYGVSLALFIVALRHLGTARTGAYFSVAPFFGAALAIGPLGEQPAAAFWVAAALMALGVWLHLTERHVHGHVHEPMEHTHEHVHDAHHQHEHFGAWDGREPHVHPHRHGRLVHSHPHYPDLHHRHDH
jgi:drug/metabolite transporter (DMT)-like permease